MELYGRSFSCPSSSCHLKRLKQLTAKEVIGNLVSVVVGVVFAVVGTVVGIIVGGLGKESISGFIRGSVVGGISGALISVEEFESFRLLWLSDAKRILCFLCLLDAIGNLASGRLVRDRVAPVLFVAVESQDIFEIGGGCKGLVVDVIHKIPEIKITTKICVDSEGEMISCSVCLEDFQVDEQARELPYCHHMFHTTCIDQWLMMHGSCPLCRRGL